MAKVIDDDDRVDVSRALFDKLTTDKRFELGEIRIPTGEKFIDELANWPGKSASFAPTPKHVVDRDGCRTVPPNANAHIVSHKIAHELYRAFAWVEWVSVHHTPTRYVVKVKHSYPVDIRPELRTWLGAQVASDGAATFELQVKFLEPQGEP